MDALGDLSPIESARAKLQEQIANFLAARARLSRLMNNPSLQIQGQARGLYAVQTGLETQLQNEIMPKVQAIEAGTWSISDVITLGGFTAQIMKQINDVGNLEKQSGGYQVGTGLFDFNASTMAIGVPLLIVAGLVGGYMLARR